MIFTNIQRIVHERLSLEGGKWNYIFHLDFESVFIIHTNNKFSQFTLEVTMAGIHVPGERSRPSFLRQIHVISTVLDRIRRSCETFETIVRNLFSRSTVCLLLKTFLYRTYTTCYCLIINEWKR